MLTHERPSPDSAPAGSASVGSLLKLLSDPSRLRILALLEREELSVGELCRALDLAQSRVSNHLRILREADLLLERRVGTSTFLRLEGAASVAPNGSAHGLGGLPGRLWDVLSDELEASPEHQADRVRLRQVLASRNADEGELFDRLAGQWDKFAGAFETGRARERAAAHLLPREFVVADLGCGTGYMAEALLGNCSRLICVDRSEGMLAEASKRLSRTARHTELEFRRGELDRLPIEDRELDGVVVGMVLHHLPELDRGLSEMMRVLKPGGTAAVLELAPHHEAWMRTELGDRHLGLEPTEVVAAFERAGFLDLVLDPVEDRYRPRRADAEPSAATVPLSLYIVRGRAPLD